MSATFDDTMKALAGKLSTLKVPMCVKVTVGGTSAYLDGAAGTWATDRSAGLRVDAMLEGSAEVFTSTLSGAVPLRRALESQALTFAGDLGLLPLLERAISGGPPKNEPSVGLDYVPRSGSSR